MPKNITISISDRIAEKMEKINEVNWSAVARRCIAAYIERRLNPDVSPLLEKLRKQKGEEYVKGRRKAEEIADSLGYSGLNILLRMYWEQIREANERSMTGPEAPWDHVPSADDITESILKEKGIIKDASNEFLKGLRERLIEIEHLLSREQ